MRRGAARCWPARLAAYGSPWWLSARAAADQRAPARPRAVAESAHMKEKSREEVELANVEDHEQEHNILNPTCPMHNPGEPQIANAIKFNQNKSVTEAMATSWRRRCCSPSLCSHLLTFNGTCRAAARFCSARRCPRPWPPEGQVDFT